MTKQYKVFMVDPPWPQKKNKRVVRPNQTENLDYETLTIPEIFFLLDSEIFPKAEENHIVFLWCIDKFLRTAESYMLNRNYKLHIRLIWSKGNGVAPNYTVRFSHEYLLWYYKEKFTKINVCVEGTFLSVFEESSLYHSKKPKIAYHIIEKMYPDCPKLDVFSREPRDNWDQFGNQCNFFTKD